MWFLYRILFCFLVSQIIGSPSRFRRKEQNTAKRNARRNSVAKKQNDQIRRRVSPRTGPDSSFPIPTYGPIKMSTMFVHGSQEKYCETPSVFACRKEHTAYQTSGNVNISTFAHTDSLCVWFIVISTEARAQWKLRDGSADSWDNRGKRNGRRNETRVSVDQVRADGVSRDPVRRQTLCHVRLVTSNPASSQLGGKRILGLHASHLRTTQRRIQAGQGHLSDPQQDALPQFSARDT